MVLPLHHFQMDCARQTIASKMLLHKRRSRATQAPVKQVFCDAGSASRGLCFISRCQIESPRARGRIYGVKPTSFRIAYIVSMFIRSMPAGLRQDIGLISQSLAYLQWLSVTRAVTGFRIKVFMRTLLPKVFSIRLLA